MTQRLRVVAADTSHPYLQLLYAEVAKHGVELVEYTKDRLLTESYDIWHLHWPENAIRTPSGAKAMVRAFRTLSLVRRAKARGAKVVWTVHNLRPHERYHPMLETLYMRRLTRQIDSYICLSEGGRDAARATYPALRKLPGFIAPLGHFRNSYPNTVTRDEARARLGVSRDTSVLVHLGMLRAYKNTARLVHVFSEMDDARALLVIAGKPMDSTIEAEIQGAARSGNSRISLSLQFVADSDVQYFLKAADLAVLPFTDILNSASAMLALSFDLPVLVPAKGAMLDLQRGVGHEWVWTYDGPLTSATLQEAVGRLRTRPCHGSPNLKRYEWEHIGRLTADAYKSISATSRYAAAREAARDVVV